MKQKSTAQASTGKEEEIARFLSEGSTPSELVKRGFARGTVYKVARLIGKKSSGEGISNDDHTPTDAEIESDPEIVRLRKDLRKAELERKLAELNGPILFEPRLAHVESELKEFDDTLSDLYETIETMNVAARGSPLTGLRENFTCSCGAKGMVAAQIQCTACGRERSYGWFPKEPR